MSFVMDIERVDSIEEEFEIRNWRVVTRQGPRTFQTRRDEWPREMPHGGVFIRDVAGDLYRVADPEALDEPQAAWRAGRVTVPPYRSRPSSSRPRAGRTQPSATTALRPGQSVCRPPAPPRRRP